MFHLGSMYDPFTFAFAFAFAFVLVFVLVVAVVSGLVVPVGTSVVGRGKYCSRSSTRAGRGCRPVPGVTGEYHSDRPNST